MPSFENWHLPTAQWGMINFPAIRFILCCKTRISILKNHRRWIWNKIGMSNKPAVFSMDRCNHVMAAQCAGKLCHNPQNTIRKTFLGWLEWCFGGLTLMLFSLMRKTSGRELGEICPSKRRRIWRDKSVLEEPQQYSPLIVWFENWFIKTGRACQGCEHQFYYALDLGSPKRIWAEGLKSSPCRSLTLAK